MKKNKAILYVLHGLTLGYSAYIESKEKRKGNADSSVDKAVLSARSLSTVTAVGSIAVAGIDQIGVGKYVMSALTEMPVELLTNHAPSWVQTVYWSVLLLGLATRFVTEIYTLFKKSNGV